MQARRLVASLPRSWPGSLFEDAAAPGRALEGSVLIGGANVSEIVDAPAARWRMVVFWLLMAALLFLHVGEWPESLTGLVRAFGGFSDGPGATHEMHWFTMSAFTWVVVAAILVNLHRPACQVGAAWTYLLGTVLAFALVLALAAVPLVVYSFGQLQIHLGSGAGDEHFEFGHWVVMGCLRPARAGDRCGGGEQGVRLAVPVVDVGPDGRGARDRFAGHHRGLTARRTPWAVLAIVWGAAFIVVGEREADSAPRGSKRVPA